MRNLNPVIVGLRSLYTLISESMSDLEYLQVSIRDCTELLLKVDSLCVPAIFIFVFSKLFLLTKVECLCSVCDLHYSVQQIISIKFSVPLWLFLFSNNDFEIPYSGILSLSGLCQFFLFLCSPPLVLFWGLLRVKWSQISLVGIFLVLILIKGRSKQRFWTVFKCRFSHINRGISWCRSYNSWYWGVA